MMVDGTTTMSTEDLRELPGTVGQISLSTIATLMPCCRQIFFVNGSAWT